MNQSPTRSRPQRGVVLLTALLIIAILTTLLTVGLTRTFTDLTASMRFKDTTQALYLAEAGIEVGTKALLSDLADHLFDNTDGVPDQTITVTNPNVQGAGGYTVSVKLLGNVAGGTQAFDLALYSLTAVGTTVSGVSQTVELTEEIDNPWKYALYSPSKTNGIRTDWHVLSNGTHVDAYNSSVGPYDPTLNGGKTALMADATTSLGGGGSGFSGNKTTPAVFVFDGTGISGGMGGGANQTTINADVQSAVANANLDTAIQERNGAIRQGQNLALPYPINLPSYTAGNCPPDKNDWIQDYTATTDSTYTNMLFCVAGDLTLDHITATWSGVIILDNGAHLNIKNSTLAAPADPATGAPAPGDLIIISLSSSNHQDTVIQMLGDSKVYAGIYAPDRPVTMTGLDSAHRGEFYGAIITNRATINAFDFYQDFDIYGALSHTQESWNQP